MATAGRRTSAPVIDRLLAEGPKFDFFQAVRLLQLWAAEAATRRPAPPLAPVGSRPIGFDFAPDQEVVRFQTTASHAFPPSAIHRLVTKALTGAANPRGNDQRVKFEMQVNFFGLIGPLGVLPQHYTSLIIARHREKDDSLRDFLDLFHHRLLAHFYRGWEKYRFPIALERFRRTPHADQDEDSFTQCLFSLVGMGTAGLRRRQEFDDETFLYYSGHFAHSPRSAVVLETMLADYFGLVLVVQQFQGQWLQLAPDDQTSLPCARWPRGLNTQLGATAIAGERVWNVQSKFRIRIGPVDYATFCRLMPSGDMLRPMCELTRSYVGAEFDYDVQPVLRAAEIPWCQLTATSPTPARLGWNTWIRSGPIPHDAEDVVFRLLEV